MRPSLIRSRLRENRVARFFCLYYPASLIPLHAAKAGFDAIWLDTEHNAWDRRELQRIIMLHHLANIDCIVRTGSRNKSELYNLLENGAAGLIIPFVNTAEDANFLVQATKFPPLGDRGLDGAGIDNDYYLKGTSGYPADANREIFLIVQIETPQAVANVDAIAAVKGVDGLFIGPGDLSLRLETPMDFNHPKMAAAEDAVAAAAARHGIAWGRPAGSAEQIAHIAAKGGRIINHGSDFGAMLTMVANYGKVMNETLEGAPAQSMGKQQARAGGY